MKHPIKNIIVLMLSCNYKLLPAETRVQKQESRKTLDALKQKQYHYVQERYAVKPYRTKWLTYTKKINELTTKINSHQLTKPRAALHPQAAPHHQDQASDRSPAYEFALALLQRTTCLDIAVFIAQTSALFACAALAWKCKQTEHDAL